MADKSPSNDTLPVIESEHQELRSLLGSLKRRLAGPAWQDGMVVSLLDSLREHMETHFAYEESDDGFEDLARRAPWVSDRVDALIAEHRHLMAAACDIASRARGGPQTAPNWAALNDSFIALHDKLIAHEQKEHELLQEVYTQDIGNKD